jgi:hypothetical protein
VTWQQHRRWRRSGEAAAAVEWRWSTAADLGMAMDEGVVIAREVELGAAATVEGTTDAGRKGARCGDRQGHDGRSQGAARRSSFSIGADEGMAAAGEDVEGGMGDSWPSTKRERQRLFGAWRRARLTGVARTPELRRIRCSTCLQGRRIRWASLVSSQRGWTWVTQTEAEDCTASFLRGVVRASPAGRPISDSQNIRIGLFGSGPG